jgi:hypothetical protein
MKSRANDRQLLWLVFGVIGGLCLAYVWPHEHVLASATDRDAKFAICTVDVGPGSPDAVFVLDFTTGRLQGAMLSPQSQSFTNFWFANVAQDFKVGKNGKYTMIPGNAFLNANNQGNGQAVATGVIYVAEVTSGMVGCYRFGYANARERMPPSALEPVDVFPFRESK